MCCPGTVALISGALSAASAGASMSANNSQLQKQDQIAAQGIARQTQLNKAAGGQVQKLVSNIAASNPAAVTAAENAKYAAALQNNSGSADANNPSLPGASKRYGNDVVSDKGIVADYGKTQAGIASRVDAPMLQRLQESEQIGSTAGDLGQLANTSQQQQTLTGLQVQSTSKNPWLMAASGLAGGAAAGVSAYGANQTKYGLNDTSGYQGVAGNPNDAASVYGAKQLRGW